MKGKSNNSMNRTLRMVAIMVLSVTNLAGNALPVTLISDPATRITNLKVQAAETPLAVEDKNPVFSWQMVSETIGQKQSAYDDSKWAKAEIVKQRDWIKSGLVARYDQAVRIAEILQAKKVMEVHSNDEHTYTYNMGVNMVGVPSVTIPAGWLKEGDVVIMRYGEQLYPDFPGDEKGYLDLYGNNGKNIAGRILTESYRGALATDFYAAANNKEVVIQPSATYRGYQYIQITIPDHAGPLPLENVRGFVLSSDKLPAGTYTAETIDDITGTYVNQLFRNIQRSQLGNFFTIPTDCPQRNERMGWTGDGKGNMTSFKTVVPANTTATLYLPVNVALSKFKGTKGVKFVKKTTRNNIVVAEYELLSGSFNFTVTADGVDVITL